MILALRGSLALLLKDLRHHAVAILAGAVLYVAVYIAILANALNTSDDSLLAAATNTAYYAGPALAAWVMRRLIVVEREDGSAQFLAALPVPPWRLWLQRAALGLAITWAIGLPLVPVTAVMVQNREIVPFGWTLVVLVQTAAVLAAWVGLCAVIGQLGPRRSAVWVAVFVGLLTLDDATEGRVYQTWTWHAALGTPLSWTRQATPGSAIAITAAWALGAAAVSGALATWRHGATVDALWRRSGSTVRDAVLLVAITLFALDLFDPWIDPEPDRWAHARAVAGPVRTSAARGSATSDGAAALASELDALGDWLGDARWPVVIVVPRHAGDGPLPHGDAEVVVRMAGPGDVVGALREVLIARTGGHLDRDEAAFWLRDGFPRAFVARSQGWADPDAVALAAVAPPGPDAPGWPAYAAAVGADAAEAVACVGFRSLVVGRGEAAVREALAARLAPRHAWAPTRAPRLDPDPAAWGEAVGHGTLALPEVRFTRGTDFGVPVRLDWQSDADLPEGATLVWAELSALRTLPDAPMSAPIAGATGQLPIGVNPDRSVFAAIEVPAAGRRLRIASVVLPP